MGMRAALVALVVTLAACSGNQLAEEPGAPDMGRAAAHASPDMAKARTAPADMAEPAALPSNAPDMAGAPQTPPGSPDMAEPPACPVLPTCDGSQLCCNGGTCIDGNCWATAGHACDTTNTVGPACIESQCWPNGVGSMSGTCR